MARLIRERYAYYRQLQGVSRREKLAVLRGLVKRLKARIDALEKTREPLVSEHNRALIEIAAIENEVSLVPDHDEPKD